MFNLLPMEKNSWSGPYTPPSSFANKEKEKDPRFADKDRKEPKFKETVKEKERAKGEKEKEELVRMLRSMKKHSLESVIKTLPKEQPE